MYIIRNALRSIGRSIGRNILIGIIVLVIAATACVGLSIRQAAATAREESMASLSVTAQISMDMKSMMQGIQPPTDGGRPSGGFNREDFGSRVEAMQSLGVGELETYATAEAVQDFYYTVTISVNGNDAFEPVSTTSEQSTDDGNNIFGGGNMPWMPQGGRGGMGFSMSSADFTVVGYSSDAAMTAFVNGTAAVNDGTCFDEQTENYDCIISTELATFNSIAVGDTVTVQNPDNEGETYTLTVVGIYDSEDTASTLPGFGKGAFNAADPTNQIYMSAAAVDKLMAASAATAEDTAVTGSVNGTYVFGSVEEYEELEQQARDLGLSEDYTISSSDLASYEQSLVPIDNLANFAEYFLWIVLAIGGVILVVLNLFNIRERKYEVGVLTAIGMKKWKVAAQFLCEVFVVTIAAVLIGGGIGAATSVPLSNALLANQVASQESGAQRQEQAFGRGDMQMPPDMPMGGGNGGGMMQQFGESAVEYIDSITASTDLTVLLQLLGIGVLLSLIAGAVSVIFIMRYDPLRILADRD